MKQAIITLIVLLGIFSCASVEFRRVKDDKNDEGLRFYRPWPYLWIGVNEKNQCVPVIIYLPDKDENYTMIPHPGLGTASFKPTLQNGWNLTAFDSTIDSKVPETLTSIAGLVGAVGGVMLGKLPTAVSKPPAAAIEAAPPVPAPKITNLSPGLYKFGCEQIKNNDNKVQKETCLHPVYIFSEFKNTDDQNTNNNPTPISCQIVGPIVLEQAPSTPNPETTPPPNKEGGKSKPSKQK